MTFGNKKQHHTAVCPTPPPGCIYNPPPPPRRASSTTTPSQPLRCSVSRTSSRHLCSPGPDPCRHSCDGSSRRFPKRQPSLPHSIHVRQVDSSSTRAAFRSAPAVHPSNPHWHPAVDEGNPK